jgi:membrane-bound lytic murein transglycosylase B
VYGIDADADGILDPYDVDDASLAIGRLLCGGGDDMSSLDGWTKAVGRQHTGDAYAQSVFNAADSYGQRTRNVE